MTSVFDWVLGKRKPGRKKRPRPDYETAKRVAAEGDLDERIDLATHEDLEPELLYFLAEDNEPEVRLEIARNDGTPLQADKLLARDAVAAVRSELAYKIGRLIPTLTEEENQRLTDMTMEVLEILASDELPEVRQIIAEEIKTLHNVPKKVVNELARDVEETVAAPILEYSPLLTEQELVQIIAGGVQGAVLLAVARRKGIGESVSGAVVDRNDKRAVTELLKNQTAAISEKTMEIIGMSAHDEPDWHRPLIERTNLSLHTIRRIATFVSASLLERLIELHPLPKELAEELSHNVRQRIEKPDLVESAKGEADDPVGRALEMQEKGRLDDANLQKAVQKGDITLMPPALSLLTGLELDVVKRILMGDSGKAVTSLVWKAGLSMETAEMVQIRVAGVPSKSMVGDPGTGGYPLSDDDMEWYLAYFEE